MTRSIEWLGNNLWIENQKKISMYCCKNRIMEEVEELKLSKYPMLFCQNTEKISYSSSFSKQNICSLVDLFITTDSNSFPSCLVWKASPILVRVIV